MESFELYSAVRSYYVYRDVWEPSVGEKLNARREFDNRFDKFAVKVLKAMLNQLKDLLTKKVQSLYKLTQKTALLGATNFNFSTLLYLALHF